MITAKVVKNYGRAERSPQAFVVDWAATAGSVVRVMVGAVEVHDFENTASDFVDIDAQIQAIRAKPGARERLPVALQRAGEMLYGAELPSLKALRLSAGLSQEDFAVRMKTSQATISKWERGLVDPRASTMQKIAEALGVSVGLVAEVWCRSCKAEDAGNV